MKVKCLSQYIGLLSDKKNLIALSINMYCVIVSRNTCLELSPMNNMNKLNFSRQSTNIKVFVVCAENDSPAFHQQSSQFAKVSCHHYYFFILTPLITHKYLMWATKFR